MKRLLGSLLGPAALASTVFACSAAPQDAPAAQAAALATGASSVVPGPTIATCVASAGVVTCTYVPPKNYPFPISLVEIDGGHPAHVSLFDGKPHSVGKLPKSGSAFLGLAVSLNTTGKPASDEDVNWTLDNLNVNFDIAEGQTVSLALPFSLWPIHLSGAGSLQDAALAAYSITLTSPWTNFLEDDDTIGKPQTVVPATKAGGSADFFVIVDDKTAHVSGSASFCDASGECVIHHAFSLTGPGTYDVTATGLVGPTP